MKRYCFSAHPVYQNSYWPNSYLLQPLSVVPVYPCCQITYAEDLQLSLSDRISSVRILDCLSPEPLCETKLWDASVLSLQLAVLDIKQALAQKIAHTQDGYPVLPSAL